MDIWRQTTGLAPEFVRDGGAVMALLLVCSVFALAVCLERAWALRRSAVLPESLLSEVRAIRGPRDARLTAWSPAGARSPLAIVVGAVLAHADSPRQENEEAMVIAGRAAASGLERGLAWIEIVAATAPLLGLLGTVLGMVDVFSAVSAQGVGDAQNFSAGIKKALYTTVAGLSIGIPCLALYIHYNRRVERLAAEMEQVAVQLLGRIYAPERPPSDGEGAP